MLSHQDLEKNLHRKDRPKAKISEPALNSYDGWRHPASFEIEADEFSHSAHSNTSQLRSIDLMSIREN
jgi:hypothetical protein